MENNDAVLMAQVLDKIAKGGVLSPALKNALKKFVEKPKTRKKKVVHQKRTRKKNRKNNITRKKNNGKKKGRSTRKIKY